MKIIVDVMQKGIRDYLPKVEIHVAFQGLERPQREQQFELVAGRALQQVDGDVGGDQNQDSSNFHMSRIF